MAELHLFLIQEIISVLEGIRPEDLEEPFSDNQVDENYSVDNEVQRLLEKNTNKNTHKSTNTWVRRLETWLNNVEIQSTLFQLNAKKLDELLCRFHVQLRKKDGSNYKPDSLRAMLAALDRHFKDNGSTFSLLRDKEFEKSRKVLTLIGRK